MYPEFNFECSNKGIGVGPVICTYFILAPQFTDVQRDVANITNGKILVGHAIQNDLKVRFVNLFI